MFTQLHYKHSFSSMTAYVQNLMNLNSLYFPWTLQSSVYQFTAYFIPQPDDLNLDFLFLSYTGQTRHRHTTKTNPKHILPNPNSTERETEPERTRSSIRWVLYGPLCWATARRTSPLLTLLSHSHCSCKQHANNISHTTSRTLQNSTSFYSTNQIQHQLSSRHMKRSTKIYVHLFASLHQSSAAVSHTEHVQKLQNTDWSPSSKHIYSEKCRLHIKIRLHIWVSW